MPGLAGHRGDLQGKAPIRVQQAQAGDYGDLPMVTGPPPKGRIVILFEIGGAVKRSADEPGLLMKIVPPIETDATP